MSSRVCQMQKALVCNITINIVTARDKSFHPSHSRLCRVVIAQGMDGAAQAKRIASGKEAQTRKEPLCQNLRERTVSCDRTSALSLSQPNRA